MIGIVDYGAGNLRSVENALAKLGADFQVVREPSDLGRSEKILFPGVGHFGQMMTALEKSGLAAGLGKRIRDGAPYFGICLGLQALFERSAEAPSIPGLGILPGSIERFGEGARVPHMGWHDVDVVRPSPLLPGLTNVSHFYFAHSFYVPVCAETTATCDYSTRFVAALQRENIFGVQFHPEKSGEVGLEVLRRFVEL